MAGSTCFQSFVAASNSSPISSRGRRKHRAVLEQIAVELLHLSFKRKGKAALVHRLPKLPDKARKEGRIIVASLQHIAKAVLGQQFHVFGEHGEKAAHEKERDRLGIIELLAVLALGVFEMFGNLGQPFRHLARGLGRDLGRIEFVRIEPNQAKTFANFFLPKLFEINAKTLPVGKLRVVFSLAGEVGINLEAMANVANDEEWRPAFGRGQAPWRIPPPAGARST